MGRIYQSMTSPEIVCEEEAYEYVSYIVTTGKDYWDETPTRESRKDRDDFLKEFPEYSSRSFDSIQELPEDEKKDIVNWYFSGNWIQKELEDGKEMELFL